MTRLSTRQIAQICLKKSGPLSLMRDIFGVGDSSASASLSLKRQLLSISRNCPEMPIITEDYFEVLFGYYDEAWRSVRQNLEKLLVKPKHGGSATIRWYESFEGEGAAVNGARQQLVNFLARAEGSGSTLQTMYTNFIQRDFAGVKNNLDFLSISIPNLPQITAETIAKALTSRQVSYTIVRTTEFTGNYPPGQEPQPTESRSSATLPGYPGERPNIKQLALFREFLTGGIEQRFRTGLWRAEYYLGLEQFQEAINSYEGLLHNEKANLRSEQLEFIAIRCGHAYLALGDLLYRRLSDDSAQRDQAVGAYDAAVQVLNENGVPTDNPQAKEIIDFVEIQKEKLNNGFNFLGYADSYVPIWKPDYLLGRCEEYIDAASTLAGKFEEFLLMASQRKVEEVSYKLEQTKAKAAVSDAIAQQHKAKEQLKLIQTREEMLNDKKKWLTINAVVDFGTLVAQAAVLGKAGFKTDGGATEKAGAIQAGGGAVSSVLNYAAQFEDIGNQHKVIGIERAIAQIDVRNAIQEQTSAEHIEQLILQMEPLVKDQLLNTNQCYLLAWHFADLLITNLEAAVLYAFLYRQAVWFKRLPPDLPKVSLNYLGYLGKGANLAAKLSGAPGNLQKNVDEIKKKDIWVDKRQPLSLEMSLNRWFPLEFSRLLQDRHMDFKIPLYHLDKYQSGGVYHRRIKHIKIEIKGTESTVDPWRGRLIHSGSFLLRDKVSTLAPDTTRLIPTREELDALYANTQIGKGQGKAVKGVIPIILDEDRFEFTTDTSSVGEDGGQEVNALFEGYGAAALWRLELDNDDLRKLSDITLTFNFDIPESNSDLQRKIRTLLKAYEQELTDGEALDQILVLSMGQLFPNEFDGLQSGQSIFNLNEEVIPSTYANLEFKAVACQALDQEGKGVAGVRIEISKSGTTFSRQMTTDSAGLSDQAGSDLDVLEREQRFPLLGDWQIRLPDAADYNKFKSGNLVLFFVYSYRAKDQEN